MKEFLKKLGALPIESIQGASFHNKVLLVDEAQLLDTKYFETDYVKGCYWK